MRLSKSFVVGPNTDGGGIPLLWVACRPWLPVWLLSGHWAWLNKVSRKPRRDGRGFVYRFENHYWLDEK